MRLPWHPRVSLPLLIMALPCVRHLQHLRRLSLLPALFSVMLLSLSLLLWPALAGAQLAALPAMPAAKVAAAPVATGPAAATDAVPVEPVVIPLAEVPRRAEEAETWLEDLGESLAALSGVAAQDAEIRSLAREIEAGLSETRKAVTRTASIDTLRHVEARWSPLRRRLADLEGELGRRISRLDGEDRQLQELQRLWRRSLEEARESPQGRPPEELDKRMESVIAAAGKSRQAVTATRNRAATLQNRVLVQESRLEDALAAARRARERLEENILQRDSLPLWQLPQIVSGEGRSPRELATQMLDSLAAQLAAGLVYLQRQLLLVLITASLFVVFSTSLAALRVRAAGMGGGSQATTAAQPGTGVPPADADLSSLPVFRSPLATALLLAMLCGFSLLADGPLLLLSLLGVLSLLAAVVIVHRLPERRLRPALYGLCLLLVFDQIRFITAPVEWLPRLLFLAELLAVMAFALWVARRAGHRAAVHAAALSGPAMPAPPAGPGHALIDPRALALLVRRFALLVAGVSLWALGSNAMGYVGLAGLLGNALSGGAYAALILVALVEVLDGAFVLALHLPPLRLLASVRRHGVLMRGRFRHILHRVAFLAWLVVVLDRLALRERLFESAGAWLAKDWQAGAATMAPADLLAFGLSVWAALLVSRLVRFLLDEDVYPRLHLTRGLPYAISTMLNYLILFLGFLAGVAALGFDMTRFTILAGAFSIGVGFGLQNIFNNFISGLILLFERPVKVGDVIEMDGTVGRVEQIGIRASTVRTSSGPDIIVPNGRLISERVINWTFSSRASAILLPVSLPIGTDLARAIKALENAARGHPMVVEHPPPSAIAVRLGPDWLGLELRAWTDRADQWKEIRSELAVAGAAALMVEGISLR